MANSPLQTREARRKGLIGHMISDVPSQDGDNPAPHQDRPKPKDDRSDSRSKQNKKGKTRSIQRAYLLDEDIVYALKVKSLADNRSMSRIVNDILRKSLGKYIAAYENMSERLE